MSHAVDLGEEVLAELREVVLQHDPDPVVIAVLTGSSTRGLALSVWTAMVGDDAESHALDLLQDTIERKLL